MSESITTTPVIILDVDAYKFVPGQIIATPGALAAMREHNISPTGLLRRHLSGDWGGIPPEDAGLNNAAIQYDLQCKLRGNTAPAEDDEELTAGRVLSSYDIAPGVRIWLITEWDRSATTFLLPSEY